MGVYTHKSRLENSADETLVTREGYEGAMGAATALLESIENDQALFEAVIEGDFMEASLVNENAGEEDLLAVQEASVSGFITNVKGYLKTAWEKIQSILDKFLVLITSTVTRDNKKLVEKYRAAVVQKNLNKMKYKWSKVKGSDSAVYDDVTTGLGEKIKSMGTSFDGHAATGASLSSQSVDNLNKTLDSIKSEDKKDEMLKKVAGLTKIDGTLEKSIRAEKYVESDKLEGVSEALMKSIMDELSASTELIKSFKKGKDEVNKRYNDRLKVLTEIEKNITKALGSSENKEKVDTSGAYGDKDKGPKSQDELKVASKVIAIQQASISKEQSANIALISACTSIAKWKIKECRAVFTRAAMFNDKAVKESDEDLMDAEDEVQADIIEEMFEGIYA